MQHLGHVLVRRPDRGRYFTTREIPPRMANDERDPAGAADPVADPLQGGERGQEDELHHGDVGQDLSPVCPLVSPLLHRVAMSPDATSSARLPRPRHSVRTLLLAGVRRKELVHVSSGFRKFLGSAWRTLSRHGTACTGPRAGHACPYSAPARSPGPAVRRLGTVRRDARRCAWRRTGHGRWCTGRSRPRTPSASGPSTPTSSTGRSARASSWRSRPASAGPSRARRATSAAASAPA